jgi:protein TonB
VKISIRCDDAAMLRALRQLPLVLLLPLNLATSLPDQAPPENAPPSPTAVATAANAKYPDSTSGLEHLAKDILKAQAQNDGAHADALLKSLVLSNAYDWYDRFFGREAADVVGEYYVKAASSIPPSLAHIFVDIQLQNFSRIDALRYEHSCDDNAADEAYGVLLRRREPFPIYELRFLSGNKFIRIFPIAYVDGAFRFLLSPDYRVPGNSPRNPPAPENHPSANPVPLERRITIGGVVQAAKLIKKVQPAYPERARSEHLAGTVKIHAIIGKDGQVSRIHGVRGYCSLAESAVAAVSQWRYSPTLFNGQPVEVDTEIDVIYALSK